MKGINGCLMVKKTMIQQAKPGSYSLDGLDFCCACINHKHELKAYKMILVYSILEYNNSPGRSLKGP